MLYCPNFAMGGPDKIAMLAIFATKEDIDTKQEVKVEKFHYLYNPDGRWTKHDDYMKAYSDMQYDTLEEAIRETIDLLFDMLR